MTSRHGPDTPGESRRRRSLGRAGESVARDYLESRGFRILATNYRHRVGEIDIIAFGNRTLVFCEVKTRVGSGDPVEGYSETQQHRMADMSQAYLVEHEDILPKVFDLRYDLIVVGDGPAGVLEVKEHIADAFRPS